MALQGNLLSVLLILVGLLAVLGGCIILLRQETTYRISSLIAECRACGQALLPLLKSPHFLLVLVAVLVFLSLGLSRIEYKSMTHVESYVPGLDLPADISEPPKRTGLIQTVRWHWHSEPHPPGFYVAMLGWTSLFGDSLTAIRIPGLLLGCLSILTMYFIGAMVMKDRWVGVLAATLLALNGYHLLWALMARHYVPAMFFGLFSLWMWMKLLAAERERPLLELMYLLALLLGLYVHVLFWLFLLAQILYTAATRRSGNLFASRLLSIQVLAVIFASPMLLHAFYTGVLVKSGREPSLEYALDFLNFGFLLLADHERSLDVALPLEAALIAVAVTSLVIYVRSKTSRIAIFDGNVKAYSLGAVTWLALGLALIVAALVRETWRPNPAFWIIAAVPLVAALACFIASKLPVPSLWFRRQPGTALSPLPVVALSVLILNFVLCLKQPSFAPQGLLIAVPPLILSMAGGLVVLVKRYRLIGATVIGLVIAAHAYSIVWYKDFLHHLDYRLVVAALEQKMQPQDQLFIRNRNWVAAPLYYHMSEEQRSHIATTDLEQRAKQSNRVWTISFWKDENQDMLRLLDRNGFEITEEYEVATTMLRLHEKTVDSGD